MGVGDVIVVVVIGIIVVFVAYFMWINRDVPKSDGWPRE